MYVCIIMEYYKLGDMDRVLKQKRRSKEHIEELVSWWCDDVIIGFNQEVDVCKLSINYADSIIILFTPLCFFVFVKLLKKWLGQMVEALCFVHDRKVIHRDLKPSNIFMKDDLSISIG